MPANRSCLWRICDKVLGSKAAWDEEGESCSGEEEAESGRSEPFLIGVVVGCGGLGEEVLLSGVVALTRHMLFL